MLPEYETSSLRLSEACSSAEHVYIAALGFHPFTLAPWSNHCMTAPHTLGWFVSVIFIFIISHFKHENYILLHVFTDYMYFLLVFIFVTFFPVTFFPAETYLYLSFL